MQPSKTFAVPGKAILFGEHAVVYGASAIAFPVARQLTAQASSNDSGPTLLAPCWDVRVTTQGDDPQTKTLGVALQKAFELTPGIQPNTTVTIDSNIPKSAGLGSSAALSVGLVRALADAAGESLATEQELNRAGEIEKVFHGNPSGIDHTVIALCKPVVFCNSSLAPASIPLAEDLNFIVATVGEHGGTGARVAALAERKTRLSQVYENLFQAIGDITEQALLALRSGDILALGALMDVNQGLLNSLGVSCYPLERAIFAAREAGALGAKLSGAGGGGAMLALCQDSTEQDIKQALAELGCSVFATRIIRENGMASFGGALEA